MKYVLHLNAIIEILFIQIMDLKFCFNKIAAMKKITLDAMDLQLLALLQRDASLSNQALAAQVHTSPATCLRRVRALHDSGLIERQIAVLNPHLLAQHQGAGLSAIIEITLDRQDAEALQRFESRAVAEAAVQQCYRVSPGPDFILVVHCADMPNYQELTQRLFTSDSNVRNVKAFFSISRSKFGAEVPLQA